MNFKRAQEIAHRYDNCALQTGCFEIFVRCYSCLFLQQVVHVVGCLFLHGFELAVEWNFIMILDSCIVAILEWCLGSSLWSLFPSSHWQILTRTHVCPCRSRVSIWCRRTLCCCMNLSGWLMMIRHCPYHLRRKHCWYSLTLWSYAWKNEPLLSRFRDSMVEPLEITDAEISWFLWTSQ